MKKFAFPLARVMDWRRTQVQIEETALEILHAELRGIETRIAETRAGRERERKALLTRESVSGAELWALDHYRRAAAAECARLGVNAAESRKRIAAQLQVVIRKRRDVRLLENLHQRKLDAWNLDLAREIDQEATELHLAAFASSGRVDQRQSGK